MFDHTSLRFLRNLILGNMVFFLWLAALDESFGTVRPEYVVNPEKRKNIPFNKKSCVNVQSLN